MCPKLVRYSPAFQDRVRAEMALLPADSAIVDLMLDYAATRDQLRQCQ